RRGGRNRRPAIARRADPPNLRARALDRERDEDVCGGRRDLRRNRPPQGFDLTGPSHFERRWQGSQIDQGGRPGRHAGDSRIPTLIADCGLRIADFLNPDRQSKIAKCGKRNGSISSIRNRIMFNLNGQIALVTGGSQGIGRATALVLARCGADVAVMARSLDKCEAVADEVRAEGRRALAVKGDMSAAAEIKAAVEKVSSGLGPIGVLVNNAAITRDGLMLRMKREDWDDVINTNLTGVF